MGVNKIGLGSLLLGLILVLAVWFLAFASKGVIAGLVALITTAIVGGAFWVGLALIVLGLLLLVL